MSIDFKCQRCHYFCFCARVDIIALMYLWHSFSMETITLGDKRIGIKTSVLEEKATACNMLCCYADELKEGFFPWIDQVYFSMSFPGYEVGGL